MKAATLTIRWLAVFFAVAMTFSAVAEAPVRQPKSRGARNRLTTLGEFPFHPGIDPTTLFSWCGVERSSTEPVSLRSRTRCWCSQGDRILDVGPSGQVSIPSNVARTVNVNGLYIVPGLIDLHMHFNHQWGEDFTRYRDSDAARAIRGVVKLGQFLDGGITAVRNVGTNNDVALKLKEAVERGMVDGPRVFWSGKIIAARGGHGDETTSTATGRPRSTGPKDNVRVATGADDWRLAVREQIRNHADWIKITAPYTREEVTAAIDEAHMHGIRVAADAFRRLHHLGSRGRTRLARTSSGHGR